MNGDILNFFLLSAVLTFHGAEAQTMTCRLLCEEICKYARGNQGLNCCLGTQGGYGENPHGKFDSFNGVTVCRSGNCNIDHVYPGYMASLIKIPISFYFSYFLFLISQR